MTAVRRRCSSIASTNIVLLILPSTLKKSVVLRHLASVLSSEANICRENHLRFRRSKRGQGEWRSSTGIDELSTSGAAKECEVINPTSNQFSHVSRMRTTHPCMRCATSPTTLFRLAPALSAVLRGLASIFCALTSPYELRSANAPRNPWSLQFRCIDRQHRWPPAA